VRACRIGASRVCRIRRTMPDRRQGARRDPWLDHTEAAHPQAETGSTTAHDDGVLSWRLVAVSIRRSPEGMIIVKRIVNGRG